MGLDMYLKKAPKINEFEQIVEWEENLEEIIKTKKYPYEIISPYIQTFGVGNFTWYSLFKEVVYWRKANAIHKWFVDNVQNGDDNCEYHQVNKEQIEKLLALCKRAIENKKDAPFLLPTQSGFFFGSTKYDEWYWEDIQFTINQLERILQEFDFENYYLAYRSSW